MWYNFREKAQYCYENVTTGDIRWKYPEEEVIQQPTHDDNVLADDDAMDISTTPPHNSEEIYPTNGMRLIQIIDFHHMCLY